MSKTRTKLMSLLVCALLAVGCFAGLGLVSAKADDAGGGALIFDYAGINRTLITGVTAAEIQTAFEAEGARVKADIEEFNKTSSGGTFTITNSPLGNGWPSGGQSYFIAAHMNFGAYSTSSLWGAGYSFIVYNPGMKAAFTVKDEAANGYCNTANSWANQLIRCGFPTGNSFVIGENTYQNFTLGYFNGSTWNAGKKMTNVEGAATEVDLTAADVAGSMIAPLFADIAGSLDAYSYTEMQAAYTAYFEGKTPEFGVMNSTTSNSNGTATLFVQDLADGSKLVYNTTKKEMFAVKDFYDDWKATAEWGDPVGEQQVTGGTTNQQFAKGVAVIGEKEAVEFHAASHVDETGKVVSDFDENAAGLLSPDAEADLPAGVTAEAVKAAAQAKYDVAAMGKASGYMEFNDGVLVQSFVKAGDAGATNTTLISVVINGTSVSAHVVSAENYVKYNQQTRFNAGLKKYSVDGNEILGAPVSDVFTALGKQYQNFQYGCMNYTDDVSRSGVNLDADGKATVLDLSKFIKIDAESIKIPKNYNIGAADLKAKFQAAYKALVQSGWAAGMPNREGIGAWAATEGGQEAGTNNFVDGKGMIKLGLHADASNADSWYNVNAFLAYNPLDGKIYLMRDGVVGNIASYYSSLGAPIGEMTETKITSKSGTEFTVYIQNFELGYVTIMASTGAGTYTEERHYDFNLRGEVNLDGSKIDGIVYPGEDEGGGNGGGDNGGGNGGGDGGKKKGCSSSAAAMAIPALAPLFALVGYCVIKRRKA